MADGLDVASPDAVTPPTAIINQAPQKPPASPALGGGGIEDILKQFSVALPQIKAMRSQEPEKLVRENVDVARKFAAEPAAPFPKADVKELPEKPEYQFRDTLQAFQNPAVVLTLFASLLTRQPLAAALKAGAAAMNGFHKGDMEMYEKSQQDWKDNLDRALKQNSLEIEKYREALDERSTTWTEKMAKLTALMSANRDIIGLAAADQGDVANVFRFLQTKDAQQTKLEQARDMAEDRTERREESERSHKEQERLRDKTIDAIRERAKQTQDRQTATRDEKARAKADELDTLVAQIDGALNMVDKEKNLGLTDAITGNAPSTGVSGALQRLYNMTLGQVFPEIGNRREFEAKLNLLQTTLQNRYLNSRYFAKGAMERMNELIPGLSATDSAKDTISHLQNLKQVVRQQIDDIRKGNVPIGTDEVQPQTAAPAGDLGDKSEDDLWKIILGNQGQAQ